MFTATVLVLLMTIPGLALFYGGLVRTKNMLSMLMQVLAIVCIVSIIWVIYGYSLAFTDGGSLNNCRRLLEGVPRRRDRESLARPSPTAWPSRSSFIAFQMTFACITPALIVGAIAERMKFSALPLFVPLWVTFVYFPIAHMVWYWAGPDRWVCRRGVAAATGEAKAGASARGRRSTPAWSSSGARSTSPAARSCTSTPASPASSAR